MDAGLLGLLAAAAAVAGFVDSIAGGGGLITVPVLMLAGVPPAQALATNKLQGVFGAATAALTYARSGMVDLRTQWRAGAVAYVAGAAGAMLVSSVPTEALRIGLPVVLIAIALFFALKPGLDDRDRTARMSRGAFALTAVPAIAFYDGLIGPGAGAFYMLSLVMLAGFGILKATAHTKLMNFASNLGGLTAFALTGHPLWIAGLVMGAAQIAGAWCGSKLAMRIGARVIKPLLVITSTALAARLIWQML